MHYEHDINLVPKMSQIIKAFYLLLGFRVSNDCRAFQSLFLFSKFPSNHSATVTTLLYAIISYGAAIWGTKEYSCINAVQNRAMRFYLGVGKYTPIIYLLLVILVAHLLAHKNTFLLSCVLSIFVHLCQFLSTHDHCLIMDGFHPISPITDRLGVYLPTPKSDNMLCKSYIRVLECNNFENVNALADGKKLRTYKLLKNEFGTVKYVELFMPKKYRSATLLYMIYTTYCLYYNKNPNPYL
jgi:hypothetical protein